MPAWHSYVPMLQIEIDENLVTTRSHNQLMNRIHRELAWRQHREFMPRHFRRMPLTFPGGQYGYRARTSKYNKQKQRKKGHQNPLVWSGELRDRTLGRGYTRVTATKDKATLNIRPIYFRTKYPIQKELAAHPPSEVKDHTEWLQKRYAELVVTDQYKRKRKRRSSP